MRWRNVESILFRVFSHSPDGRCEDTVSRQCPLAVISGDQRTQRRFHQVIPSNSCVKISREYGLLFALVEDQGAMFYLMVLLYMLWIRYFTNSSIFSILGSRRITEFMKKVGELRKMQRALFCWGSMVSWISCLKVNTKLASKGAYVGL